MRNEAGSFECPILLDADGTSFEVGGPKFEIHLVRFGVFRADAAPLKCSLDYSDLVRRYESVGASAAPGRDDGCQQNPAKIAATRLAKPPRNAPVVADSWLMDGCILGLG